MMNKTKLFWVLLAVLMLALLAIACQPQAAPTTAPTEPPAAEETEAPAVEATEAPAVEATEAPAATEEVTMMDTAQYKKDPPYTVCFSNASVSNSWRVGMKAHVDYQIEQFKKEGLIKDYIYTDANDDMNKQIADIEDLMTKGCDVMIVSAGQGEPLTPVVEKVMDAGIPVVTLDRNIVSDKYVTFVEQNSCDMGATQAKWLADKLGGKGKIVLLSGLAGATPAEDRLRCAQEVFAQYPDIEVLAQEYAQWSPVEGKKIMANWLVTYPQIDGVWADSGLQSSGAVEAFQEAGKEIPPITGEDWNRYLKMWKELGFPGYGVSFNVQMGAEAVKTAMDIVQGKQVPHYVNLPKMIIDETTLDKFVRMDLPDDYWAASLPEVAEQMFP
jgi:ribose transport system substrate-binding protein